MRLHGSTPIYEHPNSFSGMALGTIPFLIYLLPISNKIIRTFLIIQLVFSLNIILFTGSRTGYVAFCLLLFVFLFERRKNRLIIVLTLFTIVVALPLIPKQYIERFDTIYTGEDIEGHSIDMRRVILEDAIEIFTEHPFGVGIAAFPKVREKTFGRSQDTHNLYLEVATNLGLQGLLVFLAFIYSMMRTLNETKKNLGINYYKCRKGSGEL